MRDCKQSNYSNYLGKSCAKRLRTYEMKEWSADTLSEYYMLHIVFVYQTVRTLTSNMLSKSFCAAGIMSICISIFPCIHFVTQTTHRTGSDSWSWLETQLLGSTAQQSGLILSIQMADLDFISSLDQIYNYRKSVFLPV